MTPHSLLAALATGLLATSVLMAQQPPGPGGGGMPGGGMRGGQQRGAGSRGNLMLQLLAYDTNENLLIEDDELDAGLKQLKREAESAVVLLLKGIDIDGDGKLGKEEALGLKELLRVISILQEYDDNGNWQLDTKEMSALKVRLSAACESFNQNLIWGFDQNGDGKLGGQEVVKARKQVEAQKSIWEEERSGMRR